MLFSINWPNFIVWLPLLLEILGKICVIIICCPVCDIINIEINLSFFIKRFFYHILSKKKNTLIVNIQTAYLTHFWPISSCYAPENTGKLKVFQCFQEVWNKKIGQKWVKLFSSLKAFLNTFNQSQTYVKFLSIIWMFQLILSSFLVTFFIGSSFTKTFRCSLLSGIAGYSIHRKMKLSKERDIQNRLRSHFR